MLLDLFGTMVNFHSVFFSTLNRVLIDHGLEDKAEDFKTRWQSFVFQGQSKGGFITVREDFINSLSSVLGGLGCKGDLDVYAEGVIDGMFKNLREAELFPEVPKVIAALEAAGLPWAIVSNVDEEDLQAIVTNQGLRPASAISSERVRSYKPDGAIFQAALDDLGLPASRVLHVGDSPVADVKGAIDAGIDVLWVNRRNEPFPDDLPPPGWDVPDLSGLPALLLRD